MENNQTIKAKKAIIDCLIYFNIFKHPLTSFEIYKYLNFKIKYAELRDILNELLLLDKIKRKNSFYFLSGQENIIEERFKKINYFKRKRKKAQRFVSKISLFPWVKGVALANIIGDHNLRNSSDIDLFIISSPGRIWLCRLTCSFLAKILGLRPNYKTKKDKICLSFYISSDNLDLEKYLYNNDDLYFVHWLANLEALYDSSDIFKKIYLKNIWLKKYLPNASWDSEHKEKNQKVNNNYLVDFIEKLVKKYQIKIMPQKLKSQLGVSSGIILENNIIKLFLEDKRSYFISRFRKDLNDFYAKNY